ncbi:MAG: dUTP diphosphatase [Acidimicrobiia bacterium]|nr:dUTP diphosphatase [Acidimicrobiia bacterium]
MKIPLIRLDAGLPAPERSHPGDGAVDLRSREDVRLDPGERQMVPTGVAVAIPDGHAGLVVPRSGLAAREGLSVVNGPGLVDSGYRGELKVILINLGSEPIEIERGDRIAQLMVIPIVAPDFVEVDELPDSSRGDGGFGSTGV